MNSVLPKLFMAPVQTAILRRFGQVTHTISIWQQNFLPVRSIILPVWDGWLGRSLMLPTNFGSLCPKVTKVGSQNFGYQIWFCTRLIIYVLLEWHQGWGQFRFCNSNSNSGIFRFYNSNSNSRAYNSNSNSKPSIPILIPVTRWNQYTASIHIHIIVRLMVQYGKKNK